MTRLSTSKGALPETQLKTGDESILIQNIPNLIKSLESDNANERKRAVQELLNTFSKNPLSGKTMTESGLLETLVPIIKPGEKDEFTILAVSLLNNVAIANTFTYTDVSAKLIVTPLIGLVDADGEKTVSSASRVLAQLGEEKEEMRHAITEAGFVKWAAKGLLERDSSSLKDKRSAASHHHLHKRPHGSYEKKKGILKIVSGIVKGGATQSDVAGVFGSVKEVAQKGGEIGLAERAGGVLQVWERKGLGIPPEEDPSDVMHARIKLPRTVEVAAHYLDEGNTLQTSAIRLLESGVRGLTPQQKQEISKSGVLEELGALLEERGAGTDVGTICEIVDGIFEENGAGVEEALAEDKQVTRDCALQADFPRGCEPDTPAVRARCDHVPDTCYHAAADILGAGAAAAEDQLRTVDSYSPEVTKISAETRRETSRPISNWNQWSEQPEWTEWTQCNTAIKPRGVVSRQSEQQVSVYRINTAAQSGAEHESELIFSDTGIDICFVVVAAVDIGVWVTPRCRE
ncbi:MAG: hypothetical protein EZS28_019437 [Streblomastix strix]|uniref:Uncharacterized protein n=1 Tax=Streblomastix strix TaxID=222440 RepID=A0A5J4VQT2_9EUKA|nr:MAG: hypothetical protein EZS28_019437 [Streblomastix strix]